MQDVAITKGLRLNFVMRNEECGSDFRRVYIVMCNVDEISMTMGNAGCGICGRKGKRG